MDFKTLKERTEALQTDIGQLEHFLQDFDFLPADHPRTLKAKKQLGFGNDRPIESDGHALTRNRKETHINYYIRLIEFEVALLKASQIVKKLANAPAQGLSPADSFNNSVYIDGVNRTMGEARQMGVDIDPFARQVIENSKASLALQPPTDPEAYSAMWLGAIHDMIDNHTKIAQLDIDSYYFDVGRVSLIASSGFVMSQKKIDEDRENLQLFGLVKLQNAQSHFEAAMHLNNMIDETFGTVARQDRSLRQ